MASGAVKMMLFKPAQIYAAVNSEQQEAKVLQPSMTRSDVPTAPIKDSEMQVSATSNLSLPPDSCKCTFSLLSRKDQPQDAKNSVQRRLDYILQTLHNHKIAVCHSFVPFHEIYSHDLFTFFRC